MNETSHTIRPRVGSSDDWPALEKRAHIIGERLDGCVPALGLTPQRQADHGIDVARELPADRRLEARNAAGRHGFAFGQAQQIRERAHFTGQRTVTGQYFVQDDAEGVDVRGR